MIRIDSLEIYHKIRCSTNSRIWCATYKIKISNRSPLVCQSLQSTFAQYSVVSKWNLVLSIPLHIFFIKITENVNERKFYSQKERVDAVNGYDFQKIGFISLEWCTVFTICIVFFPLLRVLIKWMLPLRMVQYSRKIAILVTEYIESHFLDFLFLLIFHMPIFAN